MKQPHRVLDIITLVLGAVLLLLGIFDFSNRVVTHWPSSEFKVAYFYDSTALLLIAIGGGLVALGLVWRSWHRDP